MKKYLVGDVIYSTRDDFLYERKLIGTRINSDNEYQICFGLSSYDGSMNWQNAPEEFLTRKKAVEQIIDFLCEKERHFQRELKRVREKIADKQKEIY